MDYSDLHVRAVPWNPAEPVSPVWYRRTWHVEFNGSPDLTSFVPSAGQPDDESSRSHVVCVVTPEGAAGVRLDVFVPAPDDEALTDTARLDAATIAYDSLLLQQIVGCGPGPITINGWERHPVLNMAGRPATG